MYGNRRVLSGNRIPTSPPAVDLARSRRLVTSRSVTHQQSSNGGWSTAPSSNSGHRVFPTPQDLPHHWEIFRLVQVQYCTRTVRGLTVVKEAREVFRRHNGHPDCLELCCNGDSGHNHSRPSKFGKRETAGEVPPSIREQMRCTRIVH